MKALKQAAVSDEVKLLIVHIGSYYFGAPIEKIQDVIQRSPTTPVPLAPDNIIGLLNLRGHIVTEIDVAHTLGIDAPGLSRSSEGYSIVIDHGGEMYSLVFEGIGDVIDVERDHIEKIPDTVSRSWLELTEGVIRMGSQLVVILDFDRLIQHLTPEVDNII